MKARRILQVTGFVILIGILYDGSIFYSRWSADRANEKARAEQEAQMARKTLALLGGDSLKINSFYASPGILAPGEKADVCYGVSNAKSLKLDPPVADVYPALTHCIQVSPHKDTEYTLTAFDAAGHSVTESFILRVR
jgi:hypothetical protein